MLVLNRGVKYRGSTPIPEQPKFSLNWPRRTLQVEHESLINVERRVVVNEILPLVESVEHVHGEIDASSMSTKVGDLLVNNISQSIEIDVLQDHESSSIEERSMSTTSMFGSTYFSHTSNERFLVESSHDL